jgi:short-subunit dehydrogenase
MAYVIIGATGDLGKALASALAAKGHGLVLVARRTEALEAMANDIAEEGHRRPALVSTDVTLGPGYLAEVRTLAEDLGGVEGLLLPIGQAIRDDLDTEARETSKLIAVNLTSALDAASGLWQDLKAAPRPVVVGFGSITAIRGRRRNLAYGAAKRALEHYFESLRLLGSDDGIAVQFYVLGFMDTAKMAQVATSLPKGDVEKLAACVCAGLGQDSRNFWYPWWWRPLALALRFLPSALYHRISS